MNCKHFVSSIRTGPNDRIKHLTLMTSIVFVFGYVIEPNFADEACVWQQFMKLIELVAVRRDQLGMQTEGRKNQRRSLSKLLRMCKQKRCIGNGNRADTATVDLLNNRIWRWE